MKPIVCILILLFSISTVAQKPQLKKEKPKFTAEQQAELHSKRLALILDLDEKQIQEIKALELKRAKIREERRKLQKERQELKKEKLSQEELFQMKKEQLDAQIAHQRKMKELLSEKQYQLWRKQKERLKQRKELSKRKRARAKRKARLKKDI